MATAAVIGNPHPARETFDANTLARQSAFLSAYASLGTITEAAATVGIDREAVRWWRNNDVLGFAPRFLEAQQAYADFLEHLAHERVTNPTSRTGSDILLIAMLNANKPDKWRRDAVAAPARVQVTQIIINAPGQQQLHSEPVEPTRIIDASPPELPLPQETTP